MASHGDSQGFFDEKRKYFDEGRTLSYSFRIEQLKKLKQAIINNEENINKALFQDLQKSELESYFGEVGFALAEINHAIKHLRRWMNPNRVPTPLVLEPGSSKVHFSPKGVVLIISTWNYPVMLCLAPLIAAIAAGNTAILKPSELAPSSAQLIEDLVRETFPTEYISVVQGIGSEVIPQLMNEHIFNHVFFTGGTAVGKEIARLAAKDLVSTTLELGGKNPAIVDKSCNLKVTAKRLIWGRALNSGQACVCPDYILVEDGFKEKLVSELASAIQEFYEGNPQESESYGRIINAKRFDEVVSLLKGTTILHGGRYDKEDLFIEPTIVELSSLSSEIMSREIFGPILPIITFNTNDEILEIVRKNRYPLSTYYFGTDKKREEFILERIEFGGASINNIATHMGNPDLPFGGVQTSGSGAYHGYYGFKCFSIEKAIYKSATWIDPDVKYAPFTAFKLRILKKLMNL